MSVSGSVTTTIRMLKNTCSLETVDVINANLDYSEIWYIVTCEMVAPIM